MKQGTLITIIAVLLLGGAVVYFMTSSDTMDEQAEQNDTNTDNTMEDNTSGGNPQGGVQNKDTNRVVLAPTQTGNTATVAEATLDTDGYVVLYKVDSNGKTTVIGNSDLLQAGTHTNILVQLDSIIAREQTVVAVLHEDDGNGEFDFPDADFYLENENQAVVSDVDVVDVSQEDEAEELQEQVDTYLENNM